MAKKQQPVTEDIVAETEEQVAEISPTDLEPDTTTLKEELGFDALELKKNFDANVVELENLRHQLAQETKARKQAEADRDQLNGVINRLRVAKPESNEKSFNELADSLFN